MITEVFFNGLNLIDLQEKYVCVMSSVNHITYCQAGQLFGIHVKNINKISIFLDLERTQEMWLYQTLHDGTIHWVLRKT